MTETPALTEAVERALAAAELATQAAAEAQAASRTLAAPAPALAAEAPAAAARDRRPLVFAAVAAAGALVSVGLAGVIYLRAVTDLHEAAAMQAKAAGLMIEQIRAFGEQAAGLDAATLARQPDIARIDAALAALTPVTAADLVPLRGDLMGAIAELEVRLDRLADKAPEAGAAELTMMLGETLRRLEALPKAAAPAPAAATAPASVRSEPRAAPRPAARPPARPAAGSAPAAPTPYRFP